MRLCTNKFYSPFLGARKGAKETWLKISISTFLHVRKVAKETWLQLKYYKFTSTPLR
jgi:hypothetical protein